MRKWRRGAEESEKVGAAKIITKTLVKWPRNKGARSNSRCFDCGIPIWKGAKRCRPHAEAYRQKIDSQKTVCPRGHPLTEDNLQRYALKHGEKRCRKCKNAYQKERYDARKE